MRQRYGMAYRAGRARTVASSARVSVQSRGTRHVRQVSQPYLASSPDRRIAAVLEPPEPHQSNTRCNPRRDDRIARTHFLHHFGNKERHFSPAFLRKSENEVVEVIFFLCGHPPILYALPFQAGNARGPRRSAAKLE